jgi:lipid-A-disaccharide synthase
LSARLREIRRTLVVLGLAVSTLFSFVPFSFRLLHFLVLGRPTRRHLRGLLATPRNGEPDEPERIPAQSGRIYVVAGEDSGDLHGGNLVASLREIAPGVEVRGMGGPGMERAGCAVDFDLVRLNVMGVWPVVRAVGRFFGLFRDLLRRFEEEPPDVFVPVDYPGFNLRAARLAKRRGIRVVAYIAPQVWAWAPWRIRRMRRLVDRLLVILPFESEVFRDAGVPAPWVGHPLLEHLDGRVPRREERRPGPPRIGILPGSRRAEVETLLPWMLDAAAAVAAEHPEARFRLPYQRSSLRPVLDSILSAREDGPEVEVVEGATHETMRDLDAAFVASGTATLELAYYGVPMVVLYRLGRIASLLKGAALIVPDVALVNIVAGRRIVPEHVTHRNPSAAAAEEVKGWLADEAVRTRVVEALARVRESLLAEGVSRRAARHVLAEISRPGDPRREPPASHGSRP